MPATSHPRTLKLQFLEWGGTNPREAGPRGGMAGASGCWLLGNPGPCLLSLDPGRPQLCPNSKWVRGEWTYLVYFHRRGAGIRGQVRPFQVKRPEKDGGEGGAAASLSTQPLPHCSHSPFVILDSHNKSVLQSSACQQPPIPLAVRAGSQRGLPDTPQMPPLPACCLKQHPAPCGYPLVLLNPACGRFSPLDRLHCSLLMGLLCISPL